MFVAAAVFQPNAELLAIVLLAANAKIHIPGHQSASGVGLKSKSHTFTRGFLTVLQLLFFRPSANLWKRRSRALCAELGAQRHGLGAFYLFVLVRTSALAAAAESWSSDHPHASGVQHRDDMARGQAESVV